MYNNFFEPLFEKTDVNIISNKILFDIGEFIEAQSEITLNNLQSSLLLLNYCLDVRPLALELLANQQLKMKLQLAKIRIPQLEQQIKSILEKQSQIEQDVDCHSEISIFFIIKDFNREYLQLYLRVLRIYVLYYDSNQWLDINSEIGQEEEAIKGWFQCLKLEITALNQENKDRILDLMTYTIRQRLDWIKLLIDVDIISLLIQFLTQSQSTIRSLILLRDILEYNQIYQQQIDAQSIIQTIEEAAKSNKDQRNILIVISQIMTAINYQPEQQLSVLHQFSNEEDIEESVEKLCLLTICDQLEYSENLINQLVTLLKEETLSERALISINLIFEQMLPEIILPQIKQICATIVNLIIQKIDTQVNVTAKVDLAYIHLLAQINQLHRQLISPDQIVLLRQYHSDNVKIMRQLDEISRFNNKVVSKYKDNLLSQSGFMTQSIRQSMKNSDAASSSEGKDLENMLDQLISQNLKQGKLETIIACLVDIYSQTKENSEILYKYQNNIVELYLMYPTQEVVINYTKRILEQLDYKSLIINFFEDIDSYEIDYQLFFLAGFTLFREQFDQYNKIILKLITNWILIRVDLKQLKKLLVVSFNLNLQQKQLSHHFMKQLNRHNDIHLDILLYSVLARQGKQLEEELLTNLLNQYLEDAKYDIQIENISSDNIIRLESLFQLVSLTNHNEIYNQISRELSYDLSQITFVQSLGVCNIFSILLLNGQLQEEQSLNLINNSKILLILIKIIEEHQQDTNFELLQTSQLYRNMSRKTFVLLSNFLNQPYLNNNIIELQLIQSFQQSFIQQGLRSAKQLSDDKAIFNYFPILTQIVVHKEYHGILEFKSLIQQIQKLLIVARDEQVNIIIVENLLKLLQNLFTQPKPKTYYKIACLKENVIVDIGIKYFQLKEIIQQILIVLVGQTQYDQQYAEKFNSKPPQIIDEQNDQIAQVLATEFVNDILKSTLEKQVEEKQQEQKKSESSSSSSESFKSAEHQETINQVFKTEVISQQTPQANNEFAQVQIEEKIVVQAQANPVKQDFIQDDSEDEKQHNSLLKKLIVAKAVEERREEKQKEETVADNKLKLKLLKEKRQAEEQERIREQEQQNLRAQEQERLRVQEQERLRVQEQDRLRVQEQERLRVQEQERLRIQEQERLRIQEQERLLAEEKERISQIKAAEQEKIEEQIRLQAQEQERIKQEQNKAQAQLLLQAELMKKAAKSSSSSSSSDSEKKEQVKKAHIVQTVIAAEIIKEEIKPVKQIEKQSPLQPKQTAKQKKQEELKQKKELEKQQKEAEKQKKEAEKKQKEAEKHQKEQSKKNKDTDSKHNEEQLKKALVVAALVTEHKESKEEEKQKEDSKAKLKQLKEQKRIEEEKTKQEKIIQSNLEIQEKIQKQEQQLKQEEPQKIQKQSSSSSSSSDDKVGQHVEKAIKVEFVEDQFNDGKNTQLEIQQKQDQKNKQHNENDDKHKKQEEVAKQLLVVGALTSKTEKKQKTQEVKKQASPQKQESPSKIQKQEKPQKIKKEKKKSSRSSSSSSDQKQDIKTSQVEKQTNTKSNQNKTKGKQGIAMEAVITEALISGKNKQKQTEVTLEVDSKIITQQPYQETVIEQNEIQISAFRDNYQFDTIPQENLEKKYGQIQITSDVYAQQNYQSLNAYYDEPAQDFKEQSKAQDTQQQVDYQTKLTPQLEEVQESQRTAAFQDDRDGSLLVKTTVVKHQLKSDSQDSQITLTQESQLQTQIQFQSIPEVSEQDSFRYQEPAPNFYATYKINDTQMEFQVTTQIEKEKVVEQNIQIQQNSEAGKRTELEFIVASQQIDNRWKTEQELQSQMYETQTGGHPELEVKLEEYNHKQDQKLIFVTPQVLETQKEQPEFGELEEQITNAQLQVDLQTVSEDYRAVSNEASYSIQLQNAPQNYNIKPSVGKWQINTLVEASQSLKLIIENEQNRVKLQLVVKQLSLLIVGEAEARECHNLNITNMLIHLLKDNDYYEQDITGCLLIIFEYEKVLSECESIIQWQEIQIAKITVGLVQLLRKAHFIKPLKNRMINQKDIIILVNYLDDCWDETLVAAIILCLEQYCVSQKVAQLLCQYEVLAHIKKWMQKLQTETFLLIGSICLNTFAQKEFIDQKVHLLIVKAITEQNIEMRQNAYYALSCLCYSRKQAQIELLETDLLFLILIDLEQKVEPKLIEAASQLLTNLLFRADQKKVDSKILTTLLIKGTYLQINNTCLLWLFRALQTLCLSRQNSLTAISESIYDLLKRQSQNKYLIKDILQLYQIFATQQLLPFEQLVSVKFILVNNKDDQAALEKCFLILNSSAKQFSKKLCTLDNLQLFSQLIEQHKGNEKILTLILTLISNLACDRDNHVTINKSVVYNVLEFFPENQQIKHFSDKIKTSIALGEQQQTQIIQSAQPMLLENPVNKLMRGFSIILYVSSSETKTGYLRVMPSNELFFQEMTGQIREKNRIKQVIDINFAPNDQHSEYRAFQHSTFFKKDLFFIIRGKFGNKFNTISGQALLIEQKNQLRQIFGILFEKQL